MKLTKKVLFVFVFVLYEINAIRFGRVLPPEGESLAGVQTRYFHQILNHLSVKSGHWSQRYFINDQYWGGGDSPVFLMVGGESAASPYWMTGGSWVNWARKYKALLFQLEHRFYGQSHPTRNTSTENLKKYLSSQQALGDVSNFIQQVTKSNNFTAANKWILFGGSYSGNLVAWARLKYPQFVFGAISSSSPLQAEADFTQYNDVVRKSLNTVSPGCAGQVTRSIKSIQRLMRNNEGFKTLQSKFSICPGFNQNIKNDRIEFIEELTSPFASSVQYNNQLAKISISKVCAIMNNRNIPNPIDRLAKVQNTSSSDCIYASYEGLVGLSKQTSWNSNSVKAGNRQWLFQTCNEFGYYQTSETKSSLFSDSVPFDYFTQTCTDVFGPSYNPRQLNNAVAYTNRYYGGTAIQVQRVVFVQGTIDPWHILGMVQNPTPQDPFLLIRGTSHCYDMLNPKPNDPPSLKSARKTINRYINHWMSL